MDNLEFESLTSAELKQYIEKQREKDYLLVDVRQPMEFTQGHIPGAKLMPLMEVEYNLFDMPADQDLIFYCHNGGRSQYAASLVAESEIAKKKIYHLMGGLLAWEGKTLQDFPKVQVFNKTDSMEELLTVAMDLEKGAWRFYNHVLGKFNSEPFALIIKHLLKAETAHAKILYRYLQKDKKHPRPFETLFTNLKGEILEGGESLEQILKSVETMEGNLCINLMELSLDIEYSAFDLYRSMAEQAPDEESKNVFLSIAQAEKGHMRALTRAIAHCPAHSNSNLPKRA